MKKMLLILPVLLLLYGCSAPPAVNRFKPVAETPDMRLVQVNNENYILFENEFYRVNAALFEFQNVFVVPLEITNKTKKDINPPQYSVGIFDGRDLKAIPLIKREDIQKARDEMAKTGTVKTGDQRIDAAFAALTTLVNDPGKSELLKDMDNAIENYFYFRPLYAGETRKGILCFYADFTLEHPITLVARIDRKRTEEQEDEIALKFVKP